MYETEPIYTWTMKFRPYFIYAKTVVVLCGGLVTAHFPILKLFAFRPLTSNLFVVLVVQAQP